MIFTDYYKGEKLTDAKSRYDITASTCDYDLFESLLINKRGFNVGGLSFNYCPQPEGYRGKQVDAILCKGSHSITKVIRPDINSPVAYGDIAGTKDGCIIVFNPDFKEKGITVIEIFISRGAKNDKLQLWHLFTDGELKHEIETLRKKAVTKNVTGQD
jgi:hypothetical protein